MTSTTLLVLGRFLPQCFRIRCCSHSHTHTHDVHQLNSLEAARTNRPTNNLEGRWQADSDDDDDKRGANMHNLSGGAKQSKQLQRLHEKAREASSAAADADAELAAFVN